jgi:kumamolisin
MVPAEMVRPLLTSAEAATPLRIDLVLKLHHLGELRRRVAAGEVISRAEMAARYLPTEDDYQAVARWLVGQGLTVAAEGASHAVMTASGTPAQMTRAFQTSFARVNFRGEEYTAAVSEPSLPAEIQAHVTGVHGLQPYLHPRKFSTRIKPAAVSSTIAPPYLVGDILTAYDVSSSGLTGAGEQIGIIIDTVPRASDLTQFWTANGVAQSLSNIITVNVSGGTLPAPAGEETLDVSWSSGIASGAQIVTYACGDYANVDASYSRILDDLQSGARPQLHQISMSYGAGEETDETPADIESTNQLFTAMAAYGVSLFASSGDHGAYGDNDSTQQVMYPASDPNVTGVGGTSLYLNATTGAIKSETAWCSLVAPATGAGGSDGTDSSGGGSSAYFPRPSWQVGSTVPGGAMRLVPDVAFAADPTTGCYLVLAGQAVEYGGTSWASPCWAALCALINQSRLAGGQAPLSGANPSLYPLLGTASFHDIISGNNGVYAAGVGYDLMTGLGTPDFDVLLQSESRLAASAAQALPVITSATTVGGVAGGAFSYRITASNSPSTFWATGLPSGMVLDASSGLIWSTRAVAGTYPITLGAINSNGSGTGTLTLTVAVLPVVTLAANVKQVTVGTGRTGQVRLSIPTALTRDLVVHYSIKNSASNGVDYAHLPGAAVIAAGRTGKVIKIVPKGGLGGFPRRIVKIRLAAGDGYIVGTTGFAEVTILNR